MDPPPSFHWYGIVPPEAALEQGDFLDDYPLPVLPLEIADIAAAGEGATLDSTIPILRFNLVVLTQSCDIPKLSDTDDILLSPRLSYQGLASPIPWQSLVRGYVIGLHLINECTLPGREFPYQVISLKRVFASPLGVARRHALTQGPRVRLLPPYREHLGQAFARQFMRVGLPEDLPRDNPFS